MNKLIIKKYKKNNNNYKHIIKTKIKKEYTKNFIIENLNDFLYYGYFKRYINNYFLKVYKIYNDITLKEYLKIYKKVFNDFCEL